MSPPPSQPQRLQKLRETPGRLEEKFRIRDADALADALHERTAAARRLGSGSSGDCPLPEVLHLLLELSRDPLGHAPRRPADVEQLLAAAAAAAACSPTSQSPAHREQTWADIVAEEPLALDGDLWLNDVDAADEDSDAWSADGVDGTAALLPIRERLRRASQDGCGGGGSGSGSRRSAKRRKRRRCDDDDDDDDDGENSDSGGRGGAGVEAFAVEGDRAGLQALAHAQYWRRKTAAIGCEVDVALGGATERMHLHPLQMPGKLLTRDSGPALGGVGTAGGA